jgi:hypothetical protein
LISDCCQNVKLLSTHPVRVELYYASTLQGDESDLDYPTIDWKSIFATVCNTSLKKNWLSSLKAFNSPLKVVIDGVRTLVQPGSTWTPMLEDYNAPVKTMLVFCTERVISMLNIRGFEGKIIKTLKAMLTQSGSENDNCIIPGNNQIQLNESERESSGLPWGLSPSLLCLPGVDESFISQAELRTTPDYLEQFNGQMYATLILPVGYFRYRSRVKVLLLKYSSNLRVDSRSRDDFGFFTEPSYSGIAMMSEERRNDLLSQLAEVLGNCYKAEWWYRITDRMKSLWRSGLYPPMRGYPYKDKLLDFPETKEEYDGWINSCNNNCFLTRSTAFGTGLAEVTGVDQFIRMAFLDTEEDPNLDQKSRWHRCVARRLMHTICYELSKVEEVAHTDVKKHFSVGEFKKVVANHFSSERNKESDLSMAIMWRTEPSNKMYSWDNFSPILLSISDNPIPSVARREIRTPQFPTHMGRFSGPIMVDGAKKRDNFFKNLQQKGSGRVVPLHSMILYRCMIWLERNIPVKMNETPIKAHYTRFRIGSLTKNLFDIFLEEQQLCEHASGIVKLMKKSNILQSDMLQSSLANQEFWPTAADHLDIDLFTYSSEVETKMNDYLNRGDFVSAFGYAQMGYPTKAFLLYLIGVREDVITKARAGDEMNKRVMLELAGLNR